MSAFKRANWHSGLTYRQTCPLCKTVSEYTDVQLGFRPWFPDGFVYCPTCKKPLRHNENYAINGSASQGSGNSGALPNFCNQCGHKFGDGDKFCTQCGTKR